MKRITLYTRPECCLCDEARDTIDAVRKRNPFDLDVRNILDDPADYDRYKHEIPVILIDGKEIAQHQISETELELALNTDIAR